jgi:hypothetical protein
LLVACIQGSFQFASSSYKDMVDCDPNKQSKQLVAVAANPAMTWALLWLPVQEVNHGWHKKGCYNAGQDTDQQPVLGLAG